MMRGRTEYTYVATAAPVTAATPVATAPIVKYLVEFFMETPE
jgi:hypothetical protein